MALGAAGLDLGVYSRGQEAEHVVCRLAFAMRAPSMANRLADGRWTFRYGHEPDGLCQSNGRVVCAWRSTPRPKRPLGRESAPLGQCAGSSLFVDLASDEMALLIEVVVDLGMN